MSPTQTRQIEALLDKTLHQTALPGLPDPMRGKVRDVYDLGQQLLIVTTDRISAFDVVLGTVPLKGQVLNTIAAHWFEQTADLIPNHVVSVPDPCAMLVRKLDPLPVEVVVRRHITGSLWRDYQAGKGDAYGFSLPTDLKADQRFDHPIVTPTTKAEQGEHDAPISAEQIIKTGLVVEGIWKQVHRAALDLFARGEQQAAERGLILVDTKYEFGLAGDEVMVIDEVHTPDSSRYWEASEYADRFAAGQSQRMLDKENVRQWLIERGFSGQGTPPDLSAEVRVALAETYLTLQERLTGSPAQVSEQDPAERLRDNLAAAGLLQDGSK